MRQSVVRITAVDAIAVIHAAIIEIPGHIFAGTLALLIATLRPRKRSRQEEREDE
jgi:hypothetical protein